MRKSSLPAVGGLVRLVLIMSALLALAAGCAHYGGVEGVVDRARAKVAEYRPHPNLVPTPFTQGEPLALPAAGAAGKALTSPAAGPQFLAPSATVPAAAATEAEPQASATQSERATPGGADGLAATSSAAAAQATSTATPQPVATATAAPTNTPGYVPAQSAVALSNMVHYWQSWNNCGPATLAMNLSYYGSKLDQAAVAATLRPDKDDKNVSPDEMVAFARGQGLQAVARVNGDPERLKLLLSNGVPVIVETWMEPKPNDGMGHYRLLVGYDDASGEWIAYDSYDAHGVDPKKPYAGIRMRYDELLSEWHVYDNTYIVVYDQAHAAGVADILGQDLDDGAMWQRALAATQARLAQQPADAFGWFNAGSELVGLGRYSEAAQAYDQARQLGLPWRMLWYQFGPFQAYYQTQRYGEVVALTDATLKTVGNIEELYYWKGMALEAQGDGAGARQAWQRATQLNKNYMPPAEALARLK